jgi:hypothetical protein
MNLAVKTPDGKQGRKNNHLSMTTDVRISLRLIKLIEHNEQTVCRESNTKPWKQHNL